MTSTYQSATNPRQFQAVSTESTAVGWGTSPTAAVAALEADRRRLVAMADRRVRAVRRLMLAGGRLA